MSDFIPKEELAKFMAACGDNKLAQQVGAWQGCWGGCKLLCGVLCGRQ
jgi:hypothetical protein